MDERCAAMECLCNSPQRLRILDVLDDTQMDVRDLMEALNSPRSTVQRNLTVLEERDWIEDRCSGYTTTTIGRLLREEFVSMSETTDTIKRMAPFFEVVNTPPKIDISQLSDALVMTPDSGQPMSLMNRLFNSFGGVDCVRGFLPVVSSLSIELSRRVGTDDGSVPEYEYVLSSAAFDTLRQQYDSDSATETEIDPPPHIDIRVYEGDLPHGLFVSDEQLALVGYNEVGRIQAVVESTNTAAIKWGGKTYGTYRDQSTQPHETDTPIGASDTESD
ncbi:helix-turn-helix transcriptional regulator [Halococcus agarilyticus]|uniref:helix-turn-helix transcriptional regulator n=1 Tax=Halococcus agarilyticus TaxID=1232219 RepID=UPI0009ACCD70|nr:ArsR family transcriptional regulator [Halococcus agarilyticus]